MKISPSNHSMDMASLTSAGNTNHSKTLSFENGNNLRDASFSSYLNGAKETLIIKLSDSSQSLNSLISTPHEHLYLGRKKLEDGEIDVFGAEKYFNGGVDEKNQKVTNKDATRYPHEKDEQVHIDHVKPEAQSGTPSVRSESSWNSRRALLQNVPRNQPHRKTNKLYGKRFLASLGCNCACSDKNSVDIDEQNGENNSDSTGNGLVHGKVSMKEATKTGALARINESQANSWIEQEMHCKKFNESGLGLNREECFTFPVLNSMVGNLTVKTQLKGGDDTGRKSLEVFGSPVLGKEKRTLSLERRLNMLSWDAITSIVDEIRIPSSSNGMYNDNESDASSDLFEIESFSTSTNPFLARQASDGMSSCVTPTTCYAPSEASIEWSVVTASAADFSVASDSEEQRTAATTSKSNKTALNAKTPPGKDMQKRRPGILSGCKSHKAVSVAGEAHRPYEKPIADQQRNQRSDSLTPASRFRAESKLTGCDSRNGQQVFDTHSLSRSHSPRASQPLYIQ